MSQIELSIWAMMAGALVIFVVGATVEAFRHSQLSSWRAVAFVLLTAMGAILMSGWPEQMLASRIHGSCCPPRSLWGHWLAR